MAVIANTDRRRQLVESLHQTLDRLSNAPPCEERCTRCGLTLACMNAQLWFDGSEQSWDIPLFYCAKCNPEVADHRSFAA
jgi:hypothetical protein